MNLLTGNGDDAGTTFHVPGERITCDDVIFDQEYNPNKVALWVIGNEYGAICAVWAAEHEALHVACDADLLGGLAVSDDDAAEAEREHDGGGIMRLGNASEPFDSNYAWMRRVWLTPLQERLFAEARGACADNMDDYDDNL